jgi:hypothetical protein
MFVWERVQGDSGLVGFWKFLWFALPADLKSRPNATVGRGVSAEGTWGYIARDGCLGGSLPTRLVVFVSLFVYFLVRLEIKDDVRSYDRCWYEGDREPFILDGKDCQRQAAALLEPCL